MCDWVAREDAVADRSAAAIEHAVANDHDVDSATIIANLPIGHGNVSR
ncbi:hypothetical protein ACFQL7_21380 [Halocatena marina]|uniref:Uncharacterized protein n=1 Tax=Halocatena marina TaxID=2934937 RepID=A0ABD5YZ17_9EURY